MKRRKVLFSSGMCADKMLIITDAPPKEIIKWCIEYLLSTDEGISMAPFESLKASYYVRELLDTGTDGDLEDIFLIGYDEEYDLGEIYRVFLEVCEESVW